jgi:hypothetical protein
MRTLLALVVVGLLSTGVVMAEEIVKVRATPNNAFGPVMVTIITTIDPHPDNRVWEIVWDSPDGEAGASSKRLLDTESPRTWVDRRKLGPGSYIIQATVVRVHVDEKTGEWSKPTYHVAKTTLNVLEPGTPFVR